MAVSTTATAMRRTGLPELEEVPWETHFCAFYRGAEELVSLLIPYLRAGLEAGEACFWAVSPPLDTEGAWRALAAEVPDLPQRLRRGQIEIRETGSWCPGISDPATLERWAEAESGALRNGFGGLRLAANACRVEDIAGSASLQGTPGSGGDRAHRILLLCTFALESLEPFDAVEIACRHRYTIARRGDRWRAIQTGPTRRARAALAEMKAELLASSSERLQAEQETARLAAIVESSDDAIKAQDLGGIIRNWNRGAERMYGYSAAEAIGQPVSMLIPAGADNENPAMLEAIRRGAPVRRRVTVRRTKDGRTIYVSLTMSPIRDADGTIVGASTITRDITEQKRAEEALRYAVAYNHSLIEKLARFNEELEQRVADRTAELAASNRELEAFAYSVSHDLRAPVRAIAGFAQALLEDEGEVLLPEGKIYLERILRAGGRMEELIEGMLQLSRMTRSGMRRTGVDLSALAEGIASELRKRDPDREVEMSISPGLRVHADPNLLRILLENLLENAWKFTSRHLRAHIEVGARQEGNETVYFVRDDGAGFDMEYADNLFGAFRRLHSAVEFEGTGIGLATVKRIVLRHGGRVWAQGEVEKGATVSLTLPQGRWTR